MIMMNLFFLFQVKYPNALITSTDEMFYSSKRGVYFWKLAGIWAKKEKKKEGVSVKKKGPNLFWLVSGIIYNISNMKRNPTS